MLSRAMQLRAVADLVACRPPARKLRLSDFEDPLDVCANALLPLFVNGRAPTLDETKGALLAALEERSDRDVIIRAIKNAPGDGPRALPSFEDVVADLPPIDELWTGRIPIGMSTMFGSGPGTGKTFIMLYIARLVITGEPWPDGQPMEARFAGRKVIYVNGEGAEQLLKARLDGWQFDKSKLRLMVPPRGHMLDFTKREDRDRLIEGVAADNPALVVLDSLSTISSKGENNVEDVRELLAWLNDVAAEFNCAVVLIHHLRKRSVLALTEDPTLDDFRGSGHVMAGPKSVLALSMIRREGKTDRNGPRKLRQVKTNPGIMPDDLQVQFVPIDRYAANLEWSVLSPDGGPHPNCETWLIDTLQAAGAALPSCELFRLAVAAGYSKSAVYHARRLLGSRIVETKAPGSRAKLWALAPLADQSD